MSFTGEYQMWKPFASRVAKKPCEACGRTNYICLYPTVERYVVCGMDCYYLLKLRKREYHHFERRTK